jgi:hypothetical protein
VILVLLGLLSHNVLPAELALLEMTVICVLLVIIPQLVINVIQATSFLQLVYQLYVQLVEYICPIAYCAVLAQHAIYVKLVIHQELVTVV